MESSVKYFLSVPPEIQKHLVENETSIQELLRRENISIGVSLGSDPTSDETQRGKDATLVLFGSAVLFLSIVPALTRTLRALTQRKVLVREQVLLSVADSSGNVVRDSTGNPILYWADRHRLLESSNQIEKLMGKVEIPSRLSIEFSDDISG